MLIKRFYDEPLAQASYLVGCAARGVALIVDPTRDVDQYIRAAEEEGLEITHITETHIHADFVSGARELAERTGARLHLSDEGGDGWRYGYAPLYGAVPLKDGDVFYVGNVKVEAMHTPGHTPEHMSFVITDTAAADRPMGVFTGDFIFVGDVGRPDLLEKAAGVAGTMEAGARSLFRSLQRFKREIPDFVQLWPGHGAGSACGKALGAVPQSTLGYEKLFNWGLNIADEEEFVRAVLAGQPEPPKYFAEMKRINRDGPRVLGGALHPGRLPDARLAEVVGSGAVVIDTRAAARFAAGHVPGTINIPLNRSFTTWAGWLTPYDRDFYLIVDDRRSADVGEAVRDLAMIGLDRLAGYFGADAIEAWESHGRRLETTRRLTVAELAAALRSGSALIVDVRGESEWQAGHMPGVRNIPVGYLRERMTEVPPDTPVVVHCQAGGRSAIAASVLQASGFHDVADVPGGFAEWEAAGLSVERAGRSAAEAAA